MRTTLCVCFLVLPLLMAEEHLNEFYSLLEKSQGTLVEPPQTNQSRLMVKEPSLAINELLEKSSRTSESKFHPLPSSVWPKHSHLSPVLRHHNKSKKGGKMLEVSTDKSRGEASGLLPKPANRTVQMGLSPPQPTQPEDHPNSRARSAPAPGRDPPGRRMDPEENRPGKAGLFQAGIAVTPPRNNSRPAVSYNRRSSSLLQHFDVLRPESEATHDSFCMSECRKEKEEKEHLCYSQFAVNGVVHQLEVVRRGVRLVTLMVSSDGFYKSSRLYAAPDSFFFKVHLLVLDTFHCSKPCPDITLGSRYIAMGQIYHRRRHLPADLLTLLGGRLKAGDGILRSNNYVRRFNKRKHQKVVEATRTRCR
ncbi:UPF0450 protein C17orf58-like isoform X1 [Entelurus aequoreus]|uniref:UPF0450 protein C17orf58-like isoform X1 n=1 Tax=Entelurus aequoreus TaxID=161455 RepID=UPI002B1D92A3|nr:UPF0450 protein C17orf58-like isoform X1 [Entelurus aequoreus]